MAGIDTFFNNDRTGSLQCVCYVERHLIMLLDFAREFFRI